MNRCRLSCGVKQLNHEPNCAELCRVFCTELLSSPWRPKSTTENLTRLQQQGVILGTLGTNSDCQSLKFNELQTKTKPNQTRTSVSVIVSTLTHISSYHIDQYRPVKSQRKLKISWSISYWSEQVDHRNWSVLIDQCEMKKSDQIKLIHYLQNDSVSQQILTDPDGS